MYFTLYISEFYESCFVYESADIFDAYMYMNIKLYPYFTTLVYVIIYMYRVYMYIYNDRGNQLAATGSIPITEKDIAPNALHSPVVDDFDPFSNNGDRVKGINSLPTPEGHKSIVNEPSLAESGELAGGQDKITGGNDVNKQDTVKRCHSFPTIRSL